MAALRHAASRIKTESYEVQNTHQQDLTRPNDSRSNRIDGQDGSDKIPYWANFRVHSSGDSAAPKTIFT